MMKKTALFSALSLIFLAPAYASSLPSVAHETFGDVYLFEQQLPNTLSTPQGSSLSLDRQHSKDGEQSLKWRYQPGATLSINSPVTYQDRADTSTPLTFMLWIYNPQAIDTPLTFRFMQNKQPAKTFKVGMNFSGWHGIAVPFRDMTGEARGKFDALQIIAPDHAGTVFFDQLIMSVPVDQRWPIPDDSIPFVNNAVNTMVSKNWSALRMYDQMFQQHYPQLNFKVAFRDDQPETAEIYRRFDAYQGASEDKKVSHEMVEKNLAQWQTFNIQQQADGTISAKPLDHPNRQHFMKVDGVFSPDTLKALTDANMLRDIGKTLLQTALYLRSNQLSASDRAQLEAAYLLGTRYVLEQGFTRGSGYQIITHVGYQTRELFNAWFIGRHVLAQHGLLAPTQQAMMWYNATGRIFEPDDNIVDANVDILNTQLQWMVKSLLMLPDVAQRQAALAQLNTWLNKTILRSKGVAGGFKSDGSIFHHSQHYPAYAKDAFDGLAPTVYALSQSPYRLSEPAHTRLKEVLLNMRVYTKESQIPIVLSGRHPTGLHKISVAPYQWMALAGTPDGKKSVDPDLAAAYARLQNLSQFEGISAENEPSGAWAMNYASMAIQRRASSQDQQKSWLAIARGFSRYLVGNESYEKNNRYGRYLQYGQLEIIPADLTQRGFSHAGWDWNRYPGTTTIHLPYPELKAKLNQLPAAGIEEMLLSTESYSGANTLGNNSMFAMKLHGHSKYQQQSLRANKSYFMFDNRIIALGSGIENDDSAHATETTLFQFAVPQQQAISVNGQQITALDHPLHLNQPSLLIDPAGNLYSVPHQQRLTVTYGQQQSVDDRNDKPTENRIATAIIEHGKAPKNQSYEYAVVIEADQPQAPEYQVIQQDNRVHAVKDGLSQQQGYAFFEAANVTSPEATVIASDAPVMVMVNPQDNRLSLSVVNPDLNFYQGVEPDQVDAQGQQVEVSIYSRPWLTANSQPQTSTLVINGKWQLAKPQPGVKVTQHNDTTQITTTTTEAKPCVIELIK
ncbi:chondroitinase family polysaccharide lyase [Moellerella wisconsensis]|uniref:chondroitinase family polysaccharide lyase n=1 Tax=Moellerella wisconsensis TaxID=158849 RepID=UPI003BB097CF